MLKKIFHIAFGAFIAILFIFSSCRKDETISSDPSLKLSFSTDSVLFDTVFTTMGSVTKRLMVYNPNENSVVISKVSLAGGSNSPYSVNIDGASGSSVRDIEIGGNDSLYVFVRVTVDPVNGNLPLVVKDSLIFETNGNMQDVDLLAWGQDAHFILPNPDDFIEGLPPFSYIGQNNEEVHWTNDKPYVIVGYAVVDSAHLTIDAGCRIHFYNRSGLWIYRYSSITVNGTIEEPVVFQGVRLEQSYQDVPGQWDRIWINESETNSIFNYAIIKNATIGIQAETFKGGLGNTLLLNNTQILNSQGWGLFSRFYTIEGNNLLVANSGSSLVNLTSGGNYRFKNSTFANYWRYDVRKDPSLHLANYYIYHNGEEEEVYIGDLEAYFGDCIFYGNVDNEILIDKYPESTTAFNYQFDYCLLKAVDTQDDFFTNCVFNEDPLFIDPSENNYHIDTLSPVIKIGIPMGNPFDLDGIERTEKPDLGAYQWVPKTDDLFHFR